VVRLEELKTGPALVVCALVVNERNETAEYLGSLSPAERKRLDYVSSGSPISDGLGSATKRSSGLKASSAR